VVYRELGGTGLRVVADPDLMNVALLKSLLDRAIAMIGDEDAAERDPNFWRDYFILHRQSMFLARGRRWKPIEGLAGYLSAHHGFVPDELLDFRCDPPVIRIGGQES
jgi:hypothetical protein